jgi:hypothetical protein
MSCAPKILCGIFPRALFCNRGELFDLPAKKGYAAADSHRPPVILRPLREHP